MSHSKNDPLLTSTGFLLGALIGLTGFALVMVCIGVGAVLTIQRAEIEADVAAAGLSPPYFWAVVGGLAAVTAILYLTLRFLLALRAIVTSLREGDPFIDENARRLMRMGWLAAAIQVLQLPAGLLSLYFARSADAKAETFTGVDVPISGNGIFLVLTLFVLARVFRQGTQLREDLEGTV